MKPIILNSIAVIGGLILGSIVNMALVSLGGELIPPPVGADVSSMEGLTEAMAQYEPKHFLFPFLAHALGTLAGALFAVIVATSHKLSMALVIGAVFLAGGTYMVFLLPSPLWFNVIDLIFAYMPMSLIAYKLYTKLTSNDN